MKCMYLRFPQFRQKALTLSYDDGVSADKKLIDIMSKNGLKGTFNINSGKFAEESGGFRLTEEEAVALYSESGNEVAIHGVHHIPLTYIDNTMGINEIFKDRQNLERLFQKPVQGMAYANGVYSDEVVDMLKKCGVLYARTTKSTEAFEIPDDWLRLPTTCHHKNPRLMELADAFLADPAQRNFWADRARLFYLWGHSYEFDYDNNWEVIEHFAKRVGNRDDVWYATNMEIYEYVRAYKRLQFSSNEDFIYNPSNIDVYVDYFGKQVCVKAGELKRI
ncbi:MAG: polysaccharide deacetylase family protein [Clostridia bacterium]|nr:polysaccharide deacetylase family protein [Clostridia bacterium]